MTRQNIAGDFSESSPYSALDLDSQTLHLVSSSESSLESSPKSTSESTLARFIKEYQLAKTKALYGDNPLYGLIEQTGQVLRATTGLDSHTSRSLEALKKSIAQPIKVAIIGQFSSGKSTFLNALLGKEVLPSGITPITAKVCHIIYGSEFALELHYKDGTTSSKPLTYLHEVSEADNAKIAFYKLYAPLKLLESIHFLDTPGFNSQNQSDTDTTNAVLESVDGIIWLTLIDNVGKQSEKETINAHIKRYASKSLCVLNQKDRCKDKSEVETSLNYAKSAFSGLFEQVVAISAAQALKAHELGEKSAKALREESNIQSCLEFLHTHIIPQSERAKTHSICLKLFSLVAHYARLHLHASLRFENLAQQLHKSYLHFSQSYEQSAFFRDFPTLFHTLESNLQALAAHIYASLGTSKYEFVRTQKSFGFNKEVRISKDITTLPKERLELGLKDSDSQFGRDFTKLGFDISAMGGKFSEAIGAQVKEIEGIISRWNESFLPTLRTKLLQKELEGLINAYRSLARTHSVRLDSELSLPQKLLMLNYPLAISLCLANIDLKIHHGLEKHRKDEGLPLFSPTLENIRDELNAGLCFHLLQDLLLTQPLHKKAIWGFERDLKALAQKHEGLLHHYAKGHKSHYKQLLELLGGIRGFNQQTYATISSDNNKG